MTPGAMAEAWLSGAWAGRQGVLHLEALEAVAAPLPPWTLAYVPFEGRQPLLLAPRRWAFLPEFPVFARTPFDIAVDEAGYAEAVEAIRSAIAAGDVYQVCYTRQARLGGASLEAVAARLLAGDAPWRAYVRLPDGLSFVTASPELFFEVQGRTVRTQPMKGTAPRGQAEALAASQKDRAELAMITDLMRNDLTPLCVRGSVRVVNPRRLMVLPYAVQAVSDVEGQLRDGLGPLDVLAALHPGGSVTGAPKRAALEAIARLEPDARGPYCGSLGLLGADGARFSMLIRTAWTAQDGIRYGVGSGIVFDSSPAREWAELGTKLEALR